MLLSRHSNQRLRSRSQGAGLAPRPTQGSGDFTRSPRCSFGGRWHPTELIVPPPSSPVHISAGIACRHLAISAEATASWIKSKRKGRGAPTAREMRDRHGPATWPPALQLGHRCSAQVASPHRERRIIRPPERHTRSDGLHRLRRPPFRALGASLGYARLSQASCDFAYALVSKQRSQLPGLPGREFVN
jgi:hypothetical protein